MDMSICELARASLSRCFADLVGEEPVVREGIDPEGVHQMRVAIRRMRTTLRILADFFPSREAEGLRSDLSWLGTALGDVRDLDVYECLVREQARSLVRSDTQSLQPYFDCLATERERARSRLIKVLDSRRYRELEQNVRRVLENDTPEDSLPDGAATESAVDAAGKIVLHMSKRLRKSGEMINGNCSEAELHRLRIRGKRLRYVLELFVPVLGKRVQRTLRLVKKLQDCLGDHHDACVADAKLRAYADRVPLRSGSRRVLVALGELIHIQQLSASSHRHAFFKLWPELAKKIRPAKLRQKCTIR